MNISSISIHQVYCSSKSLIPLIFWGRHISFKNEQIFCMVYCTFIFLLINLHPSFYVYDNQQNHIQRIEYQCTSFPEGPIYFKILRGGGVFHTFWSSKIWNFSIPGRIGSLKSITFTSFMILYNNSQKFFGFFYRNGKTVLLHISFICCFSYSCLSVGFIIHVC